jgi:isochorismate synthase
LDSNRTESDSSGAALTGRLGALLRKAAEKSGREYRPVLASVAVPIPAADSIAVFSAAAALSRDRLLWLQPDAGFSIAASGTAYVVESSGPHRFSDTAAAWEKLCSGALIEPPVGPDGVGPILIGGFSFDAGVPSGPAWQGYPDGRMVLPRANVTIHAGRSWLTLNAVLGPGVSVDEEANEVLRARTNVLAAFAGSNGHSTVTSPTISEMGSAAGWRDEVAAAARAVRRGELGKVVLARAVRLDAHYTFDPAGALGRLSAGYPTCVVFAVARDDRCFLGATPERLLRVRDGEVSTTCLAGSYARGSTADADRKLAEALLADPKERSEHAMVLNALVDTLDGFCTRLDVPAAPSVLKLPNVQHLCTPVCGRVIPGQSVLRIVDRLHPTPSVGGTPRDAALRFIREREGLDRGWYAGAVGWVDRNGEGEFAVAIRAALLHGAQANLFAGCGIVADSDPDREYAESCIKLTPMLTALGAV